MGFWYCCMRNEEMLRRGYVLDVTALFVGQRAASVKRASHSLDTACAAAHKHSQLGEIPRKYNPHPAVLSSRSDSELHVCLQIRRYSWTASFSPHQQTTATLDNTASLSQHHRSACGRWVMAGDFYRLSELSSLTLGAVFSQPMRKNRCDQTWPGFLHSHGPLAGHSSSRISLACFVPQHQLSAPSVGQKFWRQHPKHSG